MDYAALMFIAIQRAKNAREAIKVIAELVEEHGYASSGESFSIGDPNEVWIMEIIGKGTNIQTDKKTKQNI
jgi:dipeptidase